MGLLDRLSDTNARGGFNALDRGMGAAQGVDYFSGLNPSPSTVQDEAGAASTAGVLELPTDTFGGSSGRAAPTEGRDLNTDPLSATERRFVSGISTGLGLGLGPIGGLMSKAIDFNMGRMGADVGDTGDRSLMAGLGTLSGYNAGFMNPTEYALGHASNSVLGKQDPRKVPVQDIQGVDVTPLSTENYGNDNTSVGPPVPGSTSSWRAPTTENYGNDNTSVGPAAPGSWQNGSGFSGMGPPAPGSFGAGYADGGPVGLSIGAYADGGPIMPGGPLLAMGFENGGPVTGAGNQGAASPQMINMRVNQIVRDPQFQQAVIGKMQQLMTSGQLTPQEVTMMGQIAEASMQNPALYPKLRAFVAEQGMSPLPPAFDPSVIMKVLAISRVLQESGAGQAAPGGGQPTPPGQVPPTSQAQMQNPNGMANGGFLQGPGTGRSDSIGTVNESSGQPVKVANGEYVIPEHIVRAKGRDFFDKMLRQYADVPKAGA